MRKLISPHGVSLDNPTNRHLAARDQRRQHAEDLVDRVAVAFERQIVEAFEHAHRPVGPMQLIEIDIVGLEPLEAALDRSIDLRRAVPRRRCVFAQPGHLAAAGDLGRDHHLVALFARGKPRADDRFGAALRLGLGRHGINLRGVEQGDAAPDRVVQLRMAVGLAVLLAEGHGAETQGRDLHPGAAKLAILHAPPPIPLC